LRVQDSMENSLGATVATRPDPYWTGDLTLIMATRLPIETTRAKA